MTPEEVQRFTILRAIVGSRSLGLETPESDTDEMGVLVEPLEEAMGLDAPFEQFVRTGPDEKREGNDIQIYSLRKFLRLALSGNPTILALLYIPTSRLLYYNSLGSSLRDLTPKIISRLAGKAFLGYMQAQRQRLEGTRGQKRTKRPELEEKFGYDTKYAMHVLRLGMQGFELMATGRMTYPMAEPDREFLLSVRNGKYPFDEILHRASNLEAMLKGSMDSNNSPLPEFPDRPAVQKWMCSVYLSQWKARQPLWRPRGNGFEMVPQG